MFGSSLPETTFFAVLHLVRNHVTPHHADWYAYVFWLNYCLLAGRLLFCCAVGCVVALIAKGSELVATISLTAVPIAFGLAILPFARYLNPPQIHHALVPMLSMIVESSVMIVLGGWVVRDSRLAKLRSRSAAAGVQGRKPGTGGLHSNGGFPFE